LRRFLPLLILVGLLGLVLGWLTVGSGDGSDLPAEPLPSVERTAADPLLAGSRADASDAAQDLGRVEAPPSGQSDSSAAVAEPMPTETFHVRVVRAEDGTPVPGAEVLYMDLQGVDQDRRRAAMRLYDDVEKVLEELGRIFPTGADGVAVLPRPAGSIWIAARHENLYGTESGMSRGNLAEELVIRLLPVIHIRVHVEDETGAPLAGVTVAYLTGDGLQANANAETETDERGDAELRHLETVMTDSARGARNRVVAMLPGPEPPGVDFVPENPPREPVKIVVPRCGSVLIEVLDLAGSLVGDGIPVTLQGALAPQQRAEWQERYGTPSVGLRDGLGAQTTYTAGGLARFPHVPVGQRLECMASPDRSLHQVTVGADGPLRPGEEVRIRLQQDAVHPVLTGRMVTAAGIPLGKVTLMSNYWRGWPHRRGTRQSSEFRPLDEASHFTKVLGEAEVPPGTARILAIRRSLDEDSRVQMAWIFVPERVAESGHNAGDVVLGGPIAVVGRVEDADGGPVPRAWLEWRARLAPPDAPDAPDDGHHQELARFLWRTDADGRFALEGDLPGTHHHLVVRPPEGGKAVTVPFEPGARDLRIVLEESGEIRGRLLLDPEIPGNLLIVDFDRTDPVRAGEWDSEMDWPDAASGEFSSGQVSPGTWTVRVRSAGTGESLALVDGISVRAGEVTEDPRLQVDLRGRLHLHRLTVLDPDGRRPDPIHLHLIREGEWTDSEGSNPHAFVSTEPALRGFVSAEGWGRSEVMLPGGEVAVRLGRGIPLRIELFGDGLPPAEEGLAFTLRDGGGTGPAGPPTFTSSRWLRGGWTVITAVPAPGAYSLHLEIQCEAPQDQPWFVPLRFGGQGDYAFEVRAGTEELVFRIEVTAEMAAAAREAAASPR